MKCEQCRIQFVTCNCAVTLCDSGNITSLLSEVHLLHLYAVNLCKLNLICRIVRTLWHTRTPLITVGIHELISCQPVMALSTGDTAPCRHTVIICRHAKCEQG